MIRRDYKKYYFGFIYEIVLQGCKNVEDQLEVFKEGQGRVENDFDKSDDLQ